MRDRRFGVELEFNSNLLGNLRIGEEMTAAGFGRWVGDRIEEYYDRNYGRSYSYYDQIGADGSDLEIRSPILKGTKGFKELQGVVTLLNDLGCYTTSSDGLHVHHDAPEFRNDKELIIKLLKSWQANQDHIGKFVSPSRVNRSSSPCPQLTEGSIVAFERNSNEHLDVQINRYLPRGNLNCRSLYEHGSVEFRWHEGTLNWTEIESWVKFGQSFLNGVVNRKRPIAKMQTPVVMLNRLKTNKNVYANLVEKAVSNNHSFFELGVANV